MMTVRSLVSASAVLAALSLAACSSSGSSSTATPPTSPSTTATATTPTTTTTTTLPGKGKPAIVVGDKNYTEQFVLGELYYEALQAQGFSVSIDQNIGVNQVRLKQLQDGEITMYPEYLNVWNGQIAANTRHFRTVPAAYRAAADFAKAHGLELLRNTPFSDTSGIAVTETFAQQQGVEEIRDLASLATDLNLGGPPQLQQDPTTGLPALERTYHFSPSAITYKSLEIGNQYKALDQGTVQAAYVNTTDGEFTTGNYALLADPEKVFGIGNVVPVVSAKAVAEEGPAFVATIDRVSALLTMPVIREMNALVDLAGETPAGVASRFLADHGLIPATSVITS